MSEVFLKIYNGLHFVSCFKIAHFYSHLPSFHPSFHLSFTVLQSNIGFPSFLFTSLCIQQSHSDNAAWESVTVGLTVNLFSRTINS